jgi:aldose 1-epimerase
VRRYDCTSYEREGEILYSLFDHATDSVVEITAACGMNVIRYSWQGRELILAPPSLAALRELPTRYGIPVLSLPGSTNQGKFVYRGTQYELPLNRGNHHLHGEIGRLPWQLLELGADEEDGAFITARYAYQDDPERFAYYPHAIVYILTYRLKDGSLSLEANVSNEGGCYAPFALGFHPYFQLTGDWNQVSLRIPAGAEWEKDQAGHALRLQEDRAAAVQLCEGVQLNQVEKRLIFLECSDPAARGDTAYLCRIVDEEAKLEIDYHVDSQFSKLVLFFPDWGQAVSLEPHTCVPNAFNLPLAYPESGAMELAPGEVKQFDWRIDARFIHTREDSQ